GRAYGDIIYFLSRDLFYFKVESTAKIRRALQEGDVKTANTYLGYEYMLTATVEKGKGLGKELHFPTANLHIEESYKLIPKNGVYVVKAEMGGKEVYGMMNIGYNPTVNGTQKRIEVHFFDFEADLYGREIQVRVLERIRDEHKFESIEALQQQLRKDRETSLAIINR
ncbi:MAG: riboflavin kinase, partial [Bacteroidota bacterium]